MVGNPFRRITLYRSAPAANTVDLPNKCERPLVKENSDRMTGDLRMM